MKTKSIFPTPKALFMALFSCIFLLYSCGDDDTLEEEEMEIGPVTISFTASSPTVNEETANTAEVTFVNTSTGNTPRYFWSFGDIATPIAVEVTAITEQTIVYSLSPEEQMVDVILEGRDNNGDVLGTASVTITLPAVIVEEEEPMLICGPTIFPSPVTFDNGEEFFTFGGTSFMAVANPDPSGANPEVTTVGQITNSGAAFEGTGIGLEMPADFSEDDKRVRFLFWSNVEVPLILQFVNGVNGERGVETGITHTGSGWEELILDYENAVTVFLSADDPGGEAMVPNGQYGQIVLFIDGPGSTAGDFFIDDVGVCGEDNVDDGNNDDDDDDNDDDDDDDDDGQPVIATPIAFDAGEEFFTFGGTTFQVVPNPSQTGANPADTMVGQITNSGAAFEGSGIEIPSPFADFSTDNKEVSFLFFSDIEVPLILQFVNGVNGERGVEVSATHSGSGWEEITLDYNDALTVFLSADDPGGEPMIPDGQYGQLVLFIDGPGTTTGDFFIDNIGAE